MSHRRLLLCALLTAQPAFAADGDPPEPREIRGGNDVSISDYRNVVRVQVGLGICSGVVIAPTTVLTAAHCIDTTVAARPGAFYEINHPYRRVVRYGRHPLYVENVPMEGSLNDIGLVAVSRSFTAPPAVMASAEEFRLYMHPGVMLDVAGWGLVREGIRAQRLQETSFPLVPCDPDLRRFIQHDLCLQIQPDVHEPMPGDSGAPVFFTIHGERKLVGIYVAGIEDKGLVMSVDHFRRWIARQAGLPPPPDDPPPEPPAPTSMRQLEYRNHGPSDCRVSYSYSSSTHVVSRTTTLQSGRTLTIEVPTDAVAAGSLFFHCDSRF